MKQFLDYNLPKTAYASFDAVSLKQFIIDRLSETDTFKDQNFEGSNINAFIDVVAVAYHVLLFYLNQTSSESTFTTASLKENIIKITSLLNYKPTGFQTSIVNFKLSGTENIPTGVYTVPRFTSIVSDGYSYSLIDDLSFEKTTTQLEELSIDTQLLYQGFIREHPVFTATGEEFEILQIITQSTNDYTEKYIADNTFSVYVKDINTEKWTLWSEKDTLYNSKATDKHYERRLNENGDYEIKFGDGITGQKLNPGDKIQIYYIYSDGDKGVVTKSAFTNSTFTLLNTPTFNEIVADLYYENIISSSIIKYLKANNDNNSSTPQQSESTQDIRNNASKIFSMQNRLVTLNDYETFINKNFNNVIDSIKCINNDTFTSQYIKYFYDIGLKSPLDDGRVLLNQVDFASSTNFNNIYAFATPKISPIIDDKIPNYITQSIKQLIINSTANIKMTTHNLVCVDPIYKAFAFGISINSNETKEDITTNTKLAIVRDSASKINATQIKNKVVLTIQEYFKQLQLNSLIDLFVLNSQLLGIEGVKDILTIREDINLELQKLSFAIWNPIYPEDVKYTSQNIQLKEFEYAFLYDATNINNSIIIRDE